MALAVGLILMDHRYHDAAWYKRYVDPLRTGFSLLVDPIYELADSPIRVFRRVRDYLVEREGLLRGYEALKEEHLALEVGLQECETLRRDFQRLQALLGSFSGLTDERRGAPDGERMRMLVVDLMEVDLHSERRQVTIDKGAASEVFVGQPLLTADGVVGQVIDIKFLSARVLLITDVRHELPVEIERNGLRTLAQGTGSIDRLELRHISGGEDVKRGDLVVTSGLGRRFPPGYPVARVAEIRQDPDRPFVTVIAEPVAYLDRGHKAMLIWPRLRGDSPHEEEPPAAVGGDLGEAP